MNAHSGPAEHGGRTMRELDAILELLHRILGIRTTFFDLQEREIGSCRGRGMSAYCATRRRDRAFQQRCVACDRLHLEEAKRLRAVLTYRCHHGLLEGIVPLCSRRGRYLGAVMFGQLREPGRPAPAGANPAWRRRFRRLPACSASRAQDIGYLLKCVSEYIIEKELIRLRNRPWAQKVEAYVEAHLAEPVRLRQAAAAAGCSASFLTHRFAGEFGMPFKAYLLRRKMEHAQRLLSGGASVQEVAAQLGFYDAFHFSKRFKACWGVAPSQWATPASGRLRCPADTGKVRNQRDRSQECQP
jgi:AraC-like DNA-binding protein